MHAIRARVFFVVVVVVVVVRIGPHCWTPHFEYLETISACWTVFYSCLRRNKNS